MVPKSSNFMEKNLNDKKMQFYNRNFKKSDSVKG